MSTVLNRDTGAPLPWQMKKHNLDDDSDRSGEPKAPDEE